MKQGMFESHTSPKVHCNVGDPTVYWKLVQSAFSFNILAGWNKYQQLRTVPANVWQILFTWHLKMTTTVTMHSCHFIKLIASAKPNTLPTAMDCSTLMFSHLCSRGMILKIAVTVITKLSITIYHFRMLYGPTPVLKCFGKLLYS